MKDAVREWSRGTVRISTDRTRLQVDVVHGFLAKSYWSPNVARESVARAIEGSLCFGIYETASQPERQVGFARIVTDYASFAWIGDVFVDESARGQGIATWLMEVIAGHPELQNLRRWLLATRDAHALYAKTGFTPLARPGDFMERKAPLGWTGRA